MHSTSWRRSKWLAASAALALLAGCLGGGSDGVSSSSGGSVTGAVVKGPVVDSLVCAFTITNGAKGTQVPLQLAAGSTGSLSGSCYVTPADGSYSFALPPGFTGDLLLEATGGRFCSNESEVSGGTCSGGGSLVNLGGAVMSSVVTVPATGAATVYTTPLTTAAVGAAGASLSAASFNAQFNTLAGKVLGTSAGVVTPGTRPTATSQPYLAAASTYIQGGGTLGGVVTALGKGTTTFNASTTTGTTTTTIGGGSSGGTTVTATLNAVLATTYNLKFYAGSGAGCGSLCPYTEGQDVPVTVLSDGSLSIPGKTLTNPFYRSFGGTPNTAEIIWLDAAANIEYALTDNAGGHFNEINVGNAAAPDVAGIPAYLGQLRVPTSGVQQALTAVAGTYSFAQQYAGADATWTGVSVSTDGQVSFSGGVGPSLSNVSTATVFPNVGGQVLRIYSSTDLNGHGVDSYDQVAFYLDGSNRVKDVEYYTSDGRVTGVNLRKTGDPAPVTIGDPRTATWTITADKITGTVGSTPYPITVTGFNGTSSGFIELRAISGNLDWKIRLDDVVSQITVGANTNYSCVHGDRDQREVALAISSSSTLSSRNGGNCNIVVTSITFNGSNANQIDAISGRFTAELYADGRTQSYVVSDGAFSWTRPTP